MSDDLRFDVRVMKHRVRRGELTQAEVDKHLSGLDDDAEHGEETTTQFVAAFATRASATTEDDAE